MPEKQHFYRPLVAQIVFLRTVKRVGRDRIRLHNKFRTIKCKITVMFDHMTRGSYVIVRSQSETIHKSISKIIIIISKGNQILYSQRCKPVHASICLRISTIMQLVNHKIIVIQTDKMA